MTELVALFLLVALSAYVLFGGADFGGGILESTLPPRLKRKLQATLAPVWEANHVWLIAVVVILFVGFPRIYTFVLTRLYVPVSLSLLFILVRGTFFTLRKYDPTPGRWAIVYSLLFRTSSLGAPLCFGFVLAGLLATHPGSAAAPPVDAHYLDIYVRPWWDGFGLACGAFIASLFAYSASVFFYGELEEDADRQVLARRILVFFLVTFFLGGAVLALGAWSGRVPLSRGLHPLQLLSQSGAALGVLGLLWTYRKGRTWGMRLALGTQVLSILLGWWLAHYPDLLQTEAGPIRLADTAAPYTTQLWLVIGLTVVLSLVVPLLVVLYRVFDRAGASE